VFSLEKLHRRIADEAAAGNAFERALQHGLGAVAPVYGAAAWTNRLLHEVGVRKRRSLPAVVLSVGNLTVGGTGKTPFTAWLAEWLAGEGRRPAVLARGYGRQDEEALTVVHDGRHLRAPARQAGDEPVMLAMALEKVPVLACADRWRAGRFALRKFAVDALVLDDGLQHVALERQAEIILVDATRPLSRLRLFPRGTLREPLGVLARAHLIVLTRCDDEARTRRMADRLRKRYPSATVVRTRLAPSGLRRLATGEPVGLEALSGRKAVVACGVGRPEAVRRTVESLGARVVHLEALEDHAWPTVSQVHGWEVRRRRARADAVVVTAKDAVKIAELPEIPRSILVLDVQIDFVTPKDREAAERALRARLRTTPVRGYLR
jgi:tetraacyldisaccharide 4'-kinase